MSKESKKTKYYDCPCGRKVPLDGIKVMRHKKLGSSEYCEDGAKGVITNAMEEANKKAAEKMAAADKAAGAMVQIDCVYPPCKTSVFVKAPPPGVAVGTPQHMTTLGGIPMCPKHGDWLNFYVWASINIKLQAQQTKGGIIVPGHEKFNPTLNQQPVRP